MTIEMISITDAFETPSNFEAALALAEEKQDGPQEAGMLSSIRAKYARYGAELALSIPTVNWLDDIVLR